MYMYIYMYIYIFTCMCLHFFLCMYIYVYTNIYELWNLDLQQVLLVLCHSYMLMMGAGSLLSTVSL